MTGSIRVSESPAANGSSVLDAISSWFVLDLHWLYLAAGLAMLGYGLRGMATYHRSISWAKAEGKVVEVVEHRHGEFGTATFQATIGFQDRSGTRRTFVNRRHVNDAVHYFAGDDVDVVYNPRDPRQASVEDDLPSLLLLDIVAIFLGSGFVIAAVHYAIRLS